MLKSLLNDPLQTRTAAMLQQASPGNFAAQEWMYRPLDTMYPVAVVPVWSDFYLRNMTLNAKALYTSSGTRIIRQGSRFRGFKGMD